MSVSRPKAKQATDNIAEINSVDVRLYVREAHQLSEFR